MSIVPGADAFGQGAQAQKAVVKASPVARTPWGDPDLQGVWTNSTTTPFERPNEFGNRERVTEAEVAEFTDQDRRRAATNDPTTISGPEHWYERGNRSTQASAIIDPPDGRVPPLTPEAEKRPITGTLVREQIRSFEDLAPWDRCITRGVPGSMLPTFYGAIYHILQAPGYIVIVYEMIHDARIIPLDGRPHLQAGIRQWMGDSRGHWEGDTLVVEVTNFTDKTPVYPGGTNRGVAAKVNHTTALRVVERFRRVDANTIDYRFTIEDPKTFTRPWTATLPMRKQEDARLFEYACHEGNYSVPHILSGTRADEAAADKTRTGRRP